MGANKLVVAGLLGTFLFVLAIPSPAQENRGAISGLVLDTSGASIPDVSLTLTNVDTGMKNTANTTGAGNFTFSNLMVGRYRVEAEKPGFKRYVQEPIVVSTAFTTTVNIKMEVGAVTQQVTITSTTELLNTTDASIAPQLEGKLYEDLPLSLSGTALYGTGRRQPEQFIFLLPGSSTAFQNAGVGIDLVDKMFNGNQWNTGNVLIDGVAGLVANFTGQNERITPPYEAMGEFKVETSNFAPEFGTGTFVENLTMKSGTNQFHGGLFEFHRDNALNAKGETITPLSSLLILNEYGGQVGGPVYIPKIYNGRNRTFFFFAYQNFKKVGEPPTEPVFTIPTAAERQGDFSALLNPAYYSSPIQLYNPLNKTCNSSGLAPGSGAFRCAFVNNQVPVSAEAQKYLPMLGLPNLPGSAGGTQGNFRDFHGAHVSDPVWSVKVDHEFSPKHRISGSMWDVATTSVSNAGTYNLVSNPSQSWVSGGGARIHDYYSFSPNLMSDFYMGIMPYGATGGPIPNQFTALANQPNPFGYAHLQDYQSVGTPLMFMQAATAGGNAVPIQYTQPGNAGNSLVGTGSLYWAPGKLSGAFEQPWTVGEIVDWVHGRHNFKFGFNFGGEQQVQRTGSFGEFKFSSDATAQLGCGGTCSGQGDEFASFLVGQADIIAAQGPNQSIAYEHWRAAAFVQDAWKVKPKLTLNLGLRYDIPWSFREKYDRLSGFDPLRPNPGAVTSSGQMLRGALTFLGTGPGRNGSSNFAGDPASRHEFGPRLGLAYSLNDKTVVRAGYGITFSYGNRSEIEQLENSGAFFAGIFTNSITKSSPDFGVTLFSTADGFPPQPTPLPNTDPTLLNGSPIFFVDPNGGLEPYVQQWNVGIQHYFPHGFFLDVAYIGQKGNHLPAGSDNWNELPASDLTTYGSLLTLQYNDPLAVAAGIKAPFVGFKGTVAQALRPFPQYLTINNVMDPSGMNVYHGLQMSMRKQMGDLHLMINFTGQKNLANMTPNGAPSSAGGERVTTNLGLNKSEQNYEQTRMLILSWTYDLPVGKGKRYASGAHGAVNQLIGGWAFTSIQRYENGVDFAPSGGNPVSIFNTSTLPNLIPGVPLQLHDCSNLSLFSQVRVNASAFAMNSPLQIGNAPTRFHGLRGCGYYSEDVALVKQFPIHERVHMEFRFEAYNLFNRHRFNTPNVAVTSATNANFGKITSVDAGYQPRLLQLSLKLNF